MPRVRATNRFGAVLVTWAALGCALTSLQASAQTQVLVGARAGVTLPTTFELPVGPAGGVDVTVRMARLIAAELTLEQSAHWVEAVEGQEVAAWMSAWTLGFQYRLDVTFVVPYATLGVEGRRVSRPRAGTDFGYGATFAVGAFVPMARHWYWGLEARYGIGQDGAFPTRQTYALRFGWRNFDF